MTAATAEQLQRECTEVLQRLVRFNTVNPPGNERAAIEYLERYVSTAGFETAVLGETSERPNLVADLHGAQDGPTLCFLGHVDTVLADASEWRHDPWSGDLADGYLWGRGSIDMKSQVAAEVVAAVSLARSGWRPARGTLKLVFVADEETGGDVGAHWLTAEHPDRVRCDMLFNEGGGESFEYEGNAITACAAPRRESSASTSPRTAPPATRRCPAPATTRCSNWLRSSPVSLTSPNPSRSPMPPRPCCAASARIRPIPGPRWPGSPPPNRGCARWSSRCSG